jgi:hypothetical protein
MPSSRHSGQSRSGPRPEIRLGKQIERPWSGRDSAPEHSESAPRKRVRVRFPPSPFDPQAVSREPQWTNARSIREVRRDGADADSGSRATLARCERAQQAREGAFPTSSGRAGCPRSSISRSRHDARRRRHLHVRRPRTRAGRGTPQHASAPSRPAAHRPDPDGMPLDAQHSLDEMGSSTCRAGFGADARLETSRSSLVAESRLLDGVCHPQGGACVRALSRGAPSRGWTQTSSPSSRICSARSRMRCRRRYSAAIRRASSSSRSAAARSTSASRNSGW